MRKGLRVIFQERELVVIRSKSHKYGSVFHCDNNYLMFFRQWEQQWRLVLKTGKFQFTFKAGFQENLMPILNVS